MTFWTVSSRLWGTITNWPSGRRASALSACDLTPSSSASSRTRSETSSTTAPPCWVWSTEPSFRMNLISWLCAMRLAVRQASWPRGEASTRSAACTDSCWSAAAAGPASGCAAGGSFWDSAASTSTSSQSLSTMRWARTCCTSGSAMMSLETSTYVSVSSAVLSIQIAYVPSARKIVPSRMRMPTSALRPRL